MAVSKSTWRVKLVFTGGTSPSLTQTIVRPSGYAEKEELICNRGKGKDKSFQWGAGTLALSIFFVKYAAWCSDKSNPLLFEFVGGPGSPADTIETNVLKKCDVLNWAIDMFGTVEGEGRNQLLTLIEKYSSNKTGPDTSFRQGINSKLLPSKALIIKWGDAYLTKLKEFEELETKLMAQWKNAPSNKSPSATSAHPAPSQSSANEPVIPSEPSGGQFAFSSMGAGTAIPTVRHTSQCVVKQSGGALIRINPREPQVPTGQFGLAMGALAGIQELENHRAEHRLKTA